MTMSGDPVHIPGATPHSHQRCTVTDSSLSNGSRHQGTRHRGCQERAHCDTAVTLELSTNLREVSQCSVECVYLLRHFTKHAFV